MCRMDIGDSGILPECVGLASVFQDRLLEEPPHATAPAAERRRYQELAAAAGAVCRGCPLRLNCLYEAVVCHDVAGFVAGTTQKQRLEIRRRLDIRVGSENLDSIAGVVAPNRPIDHDELLRLRRANPARTLESIARQLGCSVSTVKRHLRGAQPATGQHRQNHRPEAGPTAGHGAGREDPPGGGKTSSAPTLTEVMAVADQVITGASGKLGCAA